MGTNDLCYIRVSGIQPESTTDDIVAYFQTDRCGSGIVQEVIDDDANRTAVLVGIKGLNSKASGKLHRGSHKINGKKVKVEKVKAPSNYDKQKALVSGTCQDSPPSNVSMAITPLPAQSPAPDLLLTGSAVVKPLQCTSNYQSKDTSLATLSSQRSTELQLSKAMQQRLVSAKKDLEFLPVDVYTKHQRSPTKDKETLPMVAMVCVEGADGLTGLHLEVALDDGQEGGEIEEIAWKEDIALVTFKDAKATARVAAKGTWQVMGRSVKVSLHQRECDPLETILAQYTVSNTLVLKGLLSAVTDDHLSLHLEMESGMKENSGEYKLDRKGETALMKLSRSNAEVVFQRLASSTLPLIDKTNAMLTVERVSPVDTVLIQGIDLKDEKCGERFLTMYFQNKKKSGVGVNVTAIVYGRGKAAVTFEDMSVIRRVLSHNHAKMLGQNVSVKLYHPIFSHWFKTDDGTCISQPQRVNPVQHKNFKVPITAAVFHHLKRIDLMSPLNEKLTDTCAVATLCEQGILVEPAAGSEWEQQWATQCKGIIDSFMTTITELSLDVPPGVMGKVCPVVMAQVHNPNVTISPSGSGDQVVMIGRTSDVEELEAIVWKIIYENLDTTKKENFPVPVLVLIDQCVGQRLKGVHKNVLFETDLRNKRLQVRGTDASCDRFLQDIQILQPEVNDVPLGEEAVRLLASEGGKVLSSKIGGQSVGHYFSDADGSLPSSDVAVVTRLRLVGENRETVMKAVRSLQSTIVTTFVIVPEEFQHTVRSEAWVEMRRQIESAFFARLSPQLEKRALGIVCDVMDAEQITNDLKQFVRDKCYEDSTTEFEWLQWEYLERYSKDWAQLVRELKASGLRFELPEVQRKGPVAVKISGEATPVAGFVHHMHGLRSGIHFGRKDISKPGVVKCFKTSSGRNALKGIAASQQAVVDVFTPEEEAEEALGTPTTSFKHHMICHGTTDDGSKVNIMQGDLTDFSVDVIVNAANEKLKHGGGIAGVISRKGGPEIQRESDNFIERTGELSTGDAVLLKAVGNLPCKAIVHAVGPRWNGGHAHEEAYLAKAVRNSLIEASKHSYTSIAFPAISSGIFGVPVDICAKAMMQGIKDFSAMGQPPQLHSITIMLFQDEHVSSFTQVASSSLLHFTHMKKQRKDASTSLMVPPSYNPSQSSTTLSGLKQRSSTQSLQGLELKKGSLTSYQADVYVNTAHNKLDLKHGAVSHSLLKAGGSTIQDDCNRVVASRGTIPYWDIATTTGGRLQCNHVIHTVGDQYKFGSSEKNMESMITKVMQECTRLKATSVAFPALGTGNLGFPEDVVAEVMVRTISGYLRQNPSTTVKKVLLVIFMDSTYKAFQRAVAMAAPPQAEEVGTDTKSLGSVAGAVSHVQLPVRPVSAELLHSFLCNNVAIEIVNGDISVDDSEGIVNTAIASLQLRDFGVMGALLKKGGQELQDACTAAVDEHGTLAEGKAIMTGPGRRDGLKCRKVIHVTAPSSASGLVATVKEALKHADRAGLKSVALPAIGTGQHGFSPADAACGIAEGILQFTKSDNRHVQHIKVILFLREHFSSFAEAFEDAGKKKGFLRKTLDMVGNAFKAVRSVFGSSEQQEAVKRPSLVHASETLCIKVYAGEQSSVDNVFKEVDAFLHETIREEFVQDDKMDMFSSEVQLKLEGMASERGVQLSIDRAPINKATFKGTMADVAVLKQEVLQELQTIERKESHKKEAELLTSKIQWQWKDETEQFQDYTPEINLMMEEAHSEGKSSIRIETEEGPRTVVFEEMRETGDHPQFGITTHAVRRRDFEKERKEGEHPSSWDPMPRDPAGTGKEVECHVVPLSPTSQEYQDVAVQFQLTLGTSGGNRKIVNIERVQNPKLYTQFLARKKMMDKTNPQCQNEKQLFHGCAGKVVDAINHGGFNRSYAGLHATVHGVGVYFARDASYSASNTYSAPDHNGHKHMYLARVLTGEYTRGASGFRVPPPKDPNNPSVLYDSVVDHVHNPSMFVIFYDSQAYPEYHIEFC